MIKLKIGDNFLITNTRDEEATTFITYIMGCFHLHNKTIVGIDAKALYTDLADYYNFIKQERLTELYVLVNFNSLQKIGITTIGSWRSLFGSVMERLQADNPQTNIKVIKIHNQLNTKEYKLAQDIFLALSKDKKSILHQLKHLDEYKQFQTRFKAIPGELKVVHDSLKQMSKIKKVCDRNVTLKDLEYLDLIEKAELLGGDLMIQIKPLPIYPSEPLGKCIAKSSFESNPYLFKAASALYQGGTFGMVGTRIIVHPDFRPEFLETVDHQWDDMMKRNNWSTIGYLHFGQNHLCGGEFNDVIAHTAEHGLEYYFICLKQYITTANMRDYAGKKVWWYPIYDKEGKMMYCAALDILRNTILKVGGFSEETEQKIKDMSWEEFQKWRLSKGYSFNRLDTNYVSENISGYTDNGQGDMFLNVCQTKDPELYKKIMEGAN